MKIKKLLSLVLPFMLILSVIPTGLFSITASAETSGTTGDCTWTLDGTVLTISGDGYMYYYSSSDYLPWGKDITKVINNPGVKSIGEGAFRNCAALTSITISDSVTNIGSYAFCGCVGLMGIAIPDNITSIGNAAFYDCIALTTVAIQKGVTNIGFDAFDGCASLKMINYYGSYAHGIKIEIQSGNSELENANWNYIPLVGDLNGDEKINSLDLVNLRSCLISGNTDYESNVRCDIKIDLKINILDLIRLKKLAIAKVPEKIELTYMDGILIVNKTYQLPSSYNPGVNSEAQAALNTMFAAAKAEYNLKMWVCSGFRSYTVQKNLYNSYVRRDGAENADRYSARPGHSEHQTGLAFDINYADDRFKGTPEAAWLAANAYKYGFILRYPEGKESVTGYIYEPWHYRYVGVENAAKIYASGLTLEEYFGITSVYQN